LGNRAEITAEPGLADRHALVQRIADDLAHELKNPLNAMVINLEVLRTRVRAGNVPGALERIDVLQQETRRLQFLLEQVLHLIRPEQGSGRGFPLESLLADVGALAGLIARLGRRGFELRTPAADQPVAGAGGALRFALLSLIEAALAGAAEGDLVTLEALAGEAETTLLVTAPAGAAERLRAVLPAASRLLAEGGWLAAAVFAETGCEVRVALTSTGS